MKLQDGAEPQVAIGETRAGFTVGLLLIGGGRPGGRPSAGAWSVGINIHSQGSSQLSPVTSVICANFACR